MVSQLNSQGAVVLGVVAMPATNLNYNPNLSGQKYRHDDRENDSIRTITGSTPTFTFQTPVQNALDVIGLRVQKFTAFKFYLAKYVDAVHQANADMYENAVGATAYAVIDGFSAQQGGIVMANITVNLLSADGTTDPVQAVASEAIPAIAEPLLHTMGPVRINDTVIDGATSIDFNLNPRWAAFSSDGDIYPQVGSYDGGDAMISFSHSDPVALLAAGKLGEEINDTTNFTLLAMDPTLQVPTVTNQIVVTVGDGRIEPQSTGTSIGSVANIGIQVTCLSDAPQVHPWVIS